MFLSNFTLKIHCLQCNGIIGYYRYCKPDILRTFLLEESYWSCVFSTEHWLNRELKFLFTSWRNSNFLQAFTVKQICLNSQIDRPLSIRILYNQIFLYELFGLTFYLNVLLCKRLLSVTDYLILEIIQS